MEEKSDNNCPRRSYNVNTKLKRKNTRIVQKEPLKILETHTGTQKFALFQDLEGRNKKADFSEEEGVKWKVTDEEVFTIAHKRLIMLL